MRENIYDMTGADLARELVGKSIVEIDDETGRITLSDRTVLQLESAADCCAWFGYTLHTIDLTENAITAIERIERDADDEYLEAWTLTILSVDKRVAAIEIEGTSSSGYYCHSIELKVTRPEVW